MGKERTRAWKHLLVLAACVTLLAAGCTTAREEVMPEPKIPAETLREVEMLRHDLDQARQDASRLVQEKEKARQELDRARKDLEAARQENERLKMEMDKTRQVIEKTKEVDMEIERRRRELAR